MTFSSGSDGPIATTARRTINATAKTRNSFRILGGYYPARMLRRFPVDVHEVIELALSRVTRSITPEECDRYHLGC